MTSRLPKIGIIKAVIHELSPNVLMPWNVQVGLPSCSKRLKDAKH